MLMFYLATLVPALAIGLGATLGGPWIWISFALSPIVYPVLDFATRRLPNPKATSEFPAPIALNVLLAVVHGVLILCFLLAIGNENLSIVEKLVLTITIGVYFGQVSNANAHELIHRGQKGLHRVGQAIYVSLLNGHHTSAHVLVHHVYVATDRDPNSAKKGQSVWTFLPLAFLGSFTLGYTAEASRLYRLDRPFWRHPYIVYVLGGIFCLGVARLIGGEWGAHYYLLMSFLATLQIYLTDYVQHYGLRRKIIYGKPEPLDVLHSWNAKSWFTGFHLLNAPRHSDHHLRPARQYPELTLPERPVLPYSVPVMAAIALWPNLWRRVMHPRLAKLVQ